MSSRQSWNGMRSVMTTMSFSPAWIASMAASFANGAGTKKIDACARRRWTASRTESYTGTPSTLEPPLPGVTPATTFVPKSSIARVWNVPWWPVIPWTSTLARFVRRTATSPASGPDLHREFGGLLDRLRGMRADLPQEVPRAFLVDPFDPGDDGDLRWHRIEGLLDAHRDRIRLRDPAEDVQEDDGRLRLHEDLEGFPDLCGVVRAPEIEERPASAALQVQDVEGGHRQARPVRDHPDVPVELDERDALVVRLRFERRPILVHRRVLRMAVFGVVVHDELRAPRDDPSIRGDGEGIDLDELRVLVSEEVVRLPHDVRDLVPNPLREAESLAQGSDRIGLDADHRRDVFQEDLVPRDGFDVDPAEGARHEERLPRGPVDREAQVQFLLDGEALRKEDFLHPVASDGHPEDLRGRLASLLERRRGSNAPRLAAAPDEDLRLHHAGERRVDDPVGRGDDDPAGHGDPVPGEDLLRLVFKELHEVAAAMKAGSFRLCLPGTPRRNRCRVPFARRRQSIGVPVVVTSSRSAFMSFFVTFPGFPLPMSRPSTSTTGQ